MTILVIDSLGWGDSSVGGVRREFELDEYTEVSARYHAVGANSFGMALTDTEPLPGPQRPGLPYVNINQQSYLQYELPVGGAGKTLYIGCYCKSNYISFDGYLFQLLDHSVQPQLSVILDRDDEKLYITRGDKTGTVIGGPSKLVAEIGWYHLELKVKISNSIAANDIVLKIDGVTEITVPAGTDAQEQATNGVGYFRLGSGTAGFDEFFYSQLYVLNTDGTFANTSLGEHRIDVLYPNGNGDISQWVGSDGDSTNNFMLVDEQDIDQDTTYVETNTRFDVDLYQLENVVETPDSEGIAGVQTLLDVSKTGSATRVVYSAMRIAGTSYYSGRQISPQEDQYTLHADIWSTNPNNSSQWTESDVDAVQGGIYVNI